MPDNAVAPALDSVEPVWRPAPRLPSEDSPASAAGQVEIVAADYVLHRLDDAGAIACSEIIGADTIAGALRQVADRVDRSARADYELWMGAVKLASIEATGNPRPIPRGTGASWWKRLFAS